MLDSKACDHDLDCYLKIAFVVLLKSFMIIREMLPPGSISTYCTPSHWGMSGAKKHITAQGQVPELSRSRLAVSLVALAVRGHGVLGC